MLSARLPAKALRTDSDSCWLRPICSKAESRWWLPAKLACTSSTSMVRYCRAALVRFGCSARMRRTSVFRSWASRNWAGAPRFSLCAKASRTSGSHFTNSSCTESGRVAAPARRASASRTSWSSSQVSSSCAVSLSSSRQARRSRTSQEGSLASCSCTSRCRLSLPIRQLRTDSSRSLASCCCTAFPTALLAASALRTRGSWSASKRCCNDSSSLLFANWWRCSVFSLSRSN
ncbi:hypothetical protein D3C86_1188800 [compost metagenome]